MLNWPLCAKKEKAELRASEGQSYLKSKQESFFDNGMVWKWRAEGG